MSDRFPWFPFYVAEWRLSNTVRAMTYEQRGLFVELLAIAWDDGIRKPSLPGDATLLATLTGLGRRWSKVGAPVLAACFTLEDDRYYNAKLSHVWEVQRAKYDLRAMAGRKGGKAKAQHLANGKQNSSNATVPASVSATTDVRRRSQTEQKSSSAAPPVSAEVNGALGALMRRVP